MGIKKRREEKRYTRALRRPTTTTLLLQSALRKERGNEEEDTNKERPTTSFFLFSRSKKKECVRSSMRTKPRRNEDGNRMTSKSFDDDFDSKTRVATPPEEKEDASRVRKETTIRMRSLSSISSEQPEREHEKRS